MTITTQVCTDCRQILSFFSEQNLILCRGNKYSLYWGALLPVHFPFMVTSGSSQLNYSGWIIKLILTYSVLTLLGFLILLLFFFLSPWVKISILSAVLGRSEDFLKLFIEKKKKQTHPQMKSWYGEIIFSSPMLIKSPYNKHISRPQIDPQISKGGEF